MAEADSPLPPVARSTDASVEERPLLSKLLSSPRPEVEKAEAWELSEAKEGGGERDLGGEYFTTTSVFSTAA